MHRPDRPYRLLFPPTLRILNPLFQQFHRAPVLITGGAGFIGSNLARRLVDLEADVLLVDSMIPEYGGNLRNLEGIRDRVTLNIADIRDPHSLPFLVRGRRFLFNLAGQSSHLDSMLDPQTDLEINCRAQLALLEACRHHAPGMRIVFAGTRQIYGKPLRLPVDESHPLLPVDLNGVHKLAAENYHRLYHEVYGLPTCSLRLTNTIGPRMRIKDARQTFLGVWIRRLLEGLPLEVWGGNQRRDFTAVADAVEALLLAATHPAAPGQVFNVGGIPPVSLLDLAHRCVALHGSGSVDLRPFPPDRLRIDIGDYYADDARLRSTLGWQPTHGLEDTLAAILAYYRDNLPYYL